MAIALLTIEKAVLEQRKFSWEYSETHGYVLRGLLPWHTKAKRICATRNWQEAEKISRKWLGDKFGRDYQRQQLVTLINQIEEPASLPKKPIHKVVDENTLDLFMTDNEGGN